MPDFDPIPSYAQYEPLSARQITPAFLLALLLHGVVLMYFYKRTPPLTTEPQQIIDISFDTSESLTPPSPEKRSLPPRALPSPSEAPSVNPIQPVLETPEQTKPALTESLAPEKQNLSPAPEKIESLSSLTRIPKPLRKIEAAYPATERRAGIQAYVLAEVVIDATGKVQEVHILKSGGPAFDSTVIDALKTNSFSPGYIGDKAVPVRISIPFRFNLN